MQSFVMAISLRRCRTAVRATGPGALRRSGEPLPVWPVIGQGRPGDVDARGGSPRMLGWALVRGAWTPGWRRATSTRGWYERDYGVAACNPPGRGMGVGCCTSLAGLDILARSMGVHRRRRNGPERPGISG